MEILDKLINIFMNFSDNWLVILKISLIFIWIYFLISRLPILSKIVICLIIINEIYQTYINIDSVFYLIVLGIMLFACVKSLAFDIKIRQILKKWEKSEIRSYILRLNMKFHFLLLAMIVGYAFSRLSKDIPSNGAIVFIAIISLLLLRGYYKKLQEIKMIMDRTKLKVQNIENEKYFMIDIFCKEFKIKKNKNIDIKIIIENTIENIASKSNATLIRLFNASFCFENIYFASLLVNVNDIAMSSQRISRRAMFSKIRELIKIDNNYLEDLVLMNEGVNKYWFGNKEYFIHNIYLDDFIFCSSCGSGEFRDKINENGEWFCSALCKDTEDECLKIHNEAIQSDRFDRQQRYLQDNIKDISNALSTSLATTEGVKTWAKNEAILNRPKDTRHGFAAEVMNHEDDVFLGKDAQLIGGDRAKNGADRLVDGKYIQTKYCNEAQQSVKAGFKNGEYAYYDNNGNPMQLEVPKDQYEAAVKVMEEKIEEGKVPGVTDPNEAKNIIKKGSVTYQESVNYSKFCTKESLIYDARNGIVVATSAAGISFVITTALCFYREKDIKKAIQESSIIALSTGGKTFATYMISSQVQKIESVNNFLKQLINIEFEGGSSAAKAIGEALKGSTKIKGITTGSNGVNTSANTALRSTIVTAAATMAVTSSIEVVSMMRGQISGMQCVKNIVVNSSSIAGGTAGALAGAAIGSVVPIVGTTIGGIVGGVAGGLGASVISKKIMDNYIEDDLSKKQRVFFSHMITLSCLFKLSKEEATKFRQAIDKIILEEEDFFGKSFSLDLMLPYANHILKPIIVMIVSQRVDIPKEAFDRELIGGIIEEELKSIA